MTPATDPRDDIAALQTSLGGDAPFTYVDVQQAQMRQAALERWPFLRAIRRNREARLEAAQDAGPDRS